MGSDYCERNSLRERYRVHPVSTVGFSVVGHVRTPPDGWWLSGPNTRFVRRVTSHGVKPGYFSSYKNQYYISALFLKA